VSGPLRSNLSLFFSIVSMQSLVPPFLRALLFFLSILAVCSTGQRADLQQYGSPQTSLGEGAGGLVHLFRRSADSATFAVKEFHDHYDDNGVADDDEDTALAARREFDIATSLHHENIIEVLDLVRENQTWFMVMPYYPQSLVDVIFLDGGITAPRASCVFRQLLDGVSYMHAEGYAHHDLKVSNVMLDSKGIPKIIDFGTSYQFRELDKTIQKRWGPIGAYPYLPPEVYEVPKYDPRPVDIWALAMTFVKMMLPNAPYKTAALPCDGLEDHFGIFSWQAVAKIRGRNPESRSRKCPTIENHEDTQMIKAAVNNLLKALPQESRPIIRRMLEPRPQDRAAWAEILGDKWVSRIQCPDEVNGTDTISGLA